MGVELCIWRTNIRLELVKSVEYLFAPVKKVTSFKMLACKNAYVLGLVGTYETASFNVM